MINFEPVIWRSRQNHIIIVNNNTFFASYIYVFAYNEI